MSEHELPIGEGVGLQWYYTRADIRRRLRISERAFRRLQKQGGLRAVAKTCGNLLLYAPRDVWKAEAICRREGAALRQNPSAQDRP
jgi:hypothetical protein